MAYRPPEHPLIYFLRPERARVIPPPRAPGILWSHICDNGNGATATGAALVKARFRTHACVFCTLSRTPMPPQYMQLATRNVREE